MKARVDFAKVLMPKAMQALQSTSNYVNGSGLDHRLLELVKMRTSQVGMPADGVGYSGGFGRERVILGTSVGVANVPLASERVSGRLGGPAAVRVDRTNRPSSRLCSK